MQSAAFYAKVFNWNIRKECTSHPSFDDATGNISGTWVTDREVARASRGGAILEPVHEISPGSSAWIATFRDPAGNVLRLYTERPRQQSRGPGEHEEPSEECYTSRSFGSDIVKFK